MKEVMRELKKPEVKAAFSTIIVDTVDIASQLCEKYVCSQLGIENIGDGGWATNGWAKVKREWETVFRAITMEGYALVFISHSKDKTFTRKDGTTYNQVVPSCSTAYNEIIKNMSDIVGYISIQNGERKLILRSADDSVDCKCRFKMIEPEIAFSYESLVDALNRAIDAEAAATNGQFVTNERNVMTAAPVYDYENLKTEFSALVGNLMQKNQTLYAPRVSQIVESILGKGKKFGDCTIDQTELMNLIVEEVKALAAAG